MRGTKLFARATGALAIAAICSGPVMAAGPTTPIQHVVVIFQENVSFDHYFGTYPFAMNTGAPGVDGPNPVPYELSFIAKFCA